MAGKKTAGKKNGTQAPQPDSYWICSDHGQGHITGPECQSSVENDVYDIKVLLKLYTHHHEISGTPPTGYSKQKLKSAFNDLLNRYGLSENEYFKNTMKDFDTSGAEYIEKAVYAAIKEIENPEQAPCKKEKPQDDRTIAKKLNWTQSADTLKSVLKELEKDKYIKCGSIEKIMSGDKLPEISKVKDGSKEKILFYIFFAMHELELITEFIGYNESSGKEYLYSEGFQDIFSTGLNRSNREKYLPYDDAGKLQPIYKELYEEIQRTIKAAIK